MTDIGSHSNSISDNRGRRQLSVGFVLLPNFTLIAFSAIVDLLRLAADEGDRSRPERCSWSILAPDLKPVTASCGLQVLPWETFERPERFDYIVVVGGLVNRNSTYHPKTLEFLAAAAAKDVAIAGVCTGSFAMIEAQLMQGRKCCVSWYHLPDLVERYGDIVPVADQLFVEDGKFITCAGGLAALDLGAWMVERHLGPGRAQKSLHIMVTDTARPAAGAQPQPPSVVTVDDTRVRRAMLQICRLRRRSMTSRKASGCRSASLNEYSARWWARVSRNFHAICACSTVSGCLPIPTRALPRSRSRAGSPTSRISTGCFVRHSAARPRRCVEKDRML
jgi:transcriptional regulator GlxA family with amidase domain